MAAYRNVKEFRKHVRTGDRLFAAALVLNKAGTRCLKDLEPTLVEARCARKEGMDAYMEAKGYGPSLLVPVIEEKLMYGLAFLPARACLFRTEDKAWHYYLAQLKECIALNANTLDKALATKAYLDEVLRNCMRHEIG